MEVTSVSKAPQPLSGAPAAVYVITHDDIIRSGATTIPEILRLAPNLEVFQSSAANYVITARGFNGNAGAQSFSNKLLVLIDGRSVYTPLFSGVYWDMQQVLPENIERIEVISGPGATLWGANAVNGVINIITRGADETQGGSVVVSGGSGGASASAQFGGRLGRDTAYRIYADGLWRRETETAGGAGAGDSWSRPQGGFRIDWTPPGRNAFMLQGDAYTAHESETPNDENVGGHNLLGRWTHRGEAGSELQLQAYYDHTERESENGGGNLALNVYDVDFENSFGLGAYHDIVWGVGVRIEDYRIVGSATLQFDPGARTLNLPNLFVQDSIDLTSRTRLVLGLKAEDDPYSGLALLPNVRLSWSPGPGFMAWAAMSRAVRSPTPFDEDVREYGGGALLLSGNTDFKTERLTAYEAGLRFRPNAASSVSVSAFYNDYDDLRSIEVDPTTGFFPLVWGNGIRGATKGVEMWADYDVASWWRLSAAYTMLDKDLSFASGASGLLGLAQAGSDPRRQAQLTSSMALGRGFALDLHFRYVGALPDPYAPSYVELNGRLGWRLTPRVDLALSGFNLLHERHQEYPGAPYVPREIAAELRVQY